MRISRKFKLPYFTYDNLVYSVFWVYKIFGGLVWERPCVRASDKFSITPKTDCDGQWIFLVQSFDRPTMRAHSSEPFSACIQYYSSSTKNQNQLGLRVDLISLRL